MNIGREKGLYAVTVPVELDSGASTTITFTFAGFLARTDGDYRLQVRRQPAVVPDEVARDGQHDAGLEPRHRGHRSRHARRGSRCHRRRPLRARMTAGRCGYAVVLLTVAVTGPPTVAAALSAP